MQNYVSHGRGECAQNYYFYAMKLSKCLCLKGRKEGGYSDGSLKILFFLTLFLVFSWQLSPAQGSNPFEIQTRKTPVKTVHTVQQTGLDSLSGTVEGETRNKKTLSKSGTVSTGLNPFEVDHIIIPLTVKEKTKEVINPAQNQTAAPLLWLMLFSCALLAIAINYQTKYFKSMYQSVWNLNKLMLFHREAVGKMNLAALLYYVVFAVQVALLIDFSGYLPAREDYLPFLGLLTLLVGGLYLFRHIFLFIFGRIFMVSRATSLYSFTIMVFNMFTGILLIPFNFLIGFGPESIQPGLMLVAIGLVSIVLLIRFFRGLLFITEFLPDRFFQIILYFCTLEIAPVLILIKYVNQEGLYF
ncbi:MAG: DUF4271 domain-containing protein [Saprospiraceae bacterium]|nr:DUF4271 domain-containing protein [Saprospiraceae bacterium]